MRTPLTLIVLGYLSGVSPAAPPRLNEVNPPAVRRGVDNAVQLIGKDFARGAELVFPFSAEVRGDAGSAEAASFAVKPAPQTPPGVYPVRLRTPDGISNLRLILITDTPVIKAKEPNGRYHLGRLDLEQAQRIEWPCV